MKLVKLFALVVFAAASLGLSACASKSNTTVPEPTPATYGYSK